MIWGMGRTTTYLLRGWSVIQGLVPLFALMGSSRAEGAVIAAVILLAHVLAVVRMPREPATWAIVIALGPAWVSCWLPSLGELSDAPWLAVIVVSMWPAALAVLGPRRAGPAIYLANFLTTARTSPIIDSRRVWVVECCPRRKLPGRCSLGGIGRLPIKDRLNLSNECRLEWAIALRVFVSRRRDSLSEVSSEENGAPRDRYRRARLSVRSNGSQSAYGLSPLTSACAIPSDRMDTSGRMSGCEDLSLFLTRPKKSDSSALSALVQNSRRAPA